MAQSDTDFTEKIVPIKKNLKNGTVGDQAGITAQGQMECHEEAFRITVTSDASMHKKKRMTWRGKIPSNSPPYSNHIRTLHVPSIC